ncbi:MAG: DivIVA domain-containing protein [Deltaproteobacteria bacterium]|nr:DivIVA domain-containing protein [Deltaproteobacteria bacterium]
MRITPMDIQQQEFRVRFRGFDAREVDSFLELVAEELKEALHENSALKDEVKRLRENQANFEEKEKTFQTAFVSAQRVVDEMKSNAERQAKLIVTQAELEAKKMVESAHVQAAQVQEEINQLKRQKAQMEYRVKSFIESLSKWLVSETEPPDCSEKKVAEE